MKLVYNINDKPPIKKNLVYALQQVLAIMAATLLVPLLVNNISGTNYMSQPAALFGAGVGTLFYLFATKRNSPVFLGSSFAFIGPLVGAVSCGYLGILLGALFAGLVYVVLALIIKATGSGWVNKLLPAVVIGPTVALIGFSLCGSAITNLTNTNGNGTFLFISEQFAGVEITAENLTEAVQIGSTNFYSLIHIAIGLIAFLLTVWASVKGSKGMKMIPFIIGICGSYLLALVLTFIGNATGSEALKIIDLSCFNGMKLFQLPDFTIVKAFTDKEVTVKGMSDVLNIFMLFAPVAFVTLAEHIGDHKNLSSIIGKDLITDPGLDKTLIGDGVGSIVGAIFGGCPNTTYGESVGCVAITGNASVSTIFITAIYCLVLAFFGPFVAFVNSIPTCITGGVCIALYGFIAVSGLKMIQKVDLGENRNLFVVAAILVTGIGGLELNLGPVTISAIATALILGIIVNVLFNKESAQEA